MDNNRRLELIEAEYLRHMAMARADPDRRDEHEVVAGALACALDSLKNGDITYECVFHSEL